MPARRLKLAVGTTLATAALYWVVVSQANVPAPPPPAVVNRPTLIGGLTVDPVALDLGDVWATGDHLVPLAIRNTTGHPVTISDFQTGCDCARVEPRSLTVPGGGSRTIQVTLDTRPGTPDEVGLAARPFEKTIRPFFGSGDAREGWVLRGVFRSRVWASLPAILFGESNRVGQPPVSRTVTLGTAEPCTLIASVKPAVVSSTLRFKEADGSWELTVTPRTDRPVGPFQGAITIALIPHNSNTELPVLELPFEGVLGEGRP